jgi:deoxyribonuclease V
MKINFLHDWEVTLRDAREIQNNLSKKIQIDISLNINKIKIIAAADISFNRLSKMLYAALVLVRFSDLQPIKIYKHKEEAFFPYIPGYLSFREAPPIISLFKHLSTIPDILLCDGQGLAHPRGFGLASHLGLFLDIPTIGCAKSILVGQCEEPPTHKGSYSDLIYNNKLVGVALRTRKGVKPIYISIGHKLRLGDAIKIIMHCCPRYRIPEPIRLAHSVVNEFRSHYKSLEKYN